MEDNSISNKLVDDILTSLAGHGLTLKESNEVLDEARNRINSIVFSSISAKEKELLSSHLED